MNQDPRNGMCTVRKRILLLKFYAIPGIIDGPLSLETINPGVLSAHYAVRGKLAQLANEINKEIASGLHQYPFAKTVQANLGNPQGCGQKPLTFLRQVLCLMEYPNLLSEHESVIEGIFPSDAIQKAKDLLKHTGSVGAYSSNSGVSEIRESIAKFISERDGYPAKADNVFLTCGAFEGMLIALTLISGGRARGEKTGVLIPVPQYPVYIALMKTLDLEPIPYALEEDRKWGIPSQEKMDKIIRDSRQKGCVPRCLIIINPSNPTGAILSESDLEGLIELAAKERLLLLSDEVYQSNVFPPYQFRSCRSVLLEVQDRKRDELLFTTLQLISLHSVSKGMLGEGGQRGGYFEAVGFSSEVKHEIQKLVTFTLQPATAGQILVELMVNPPKSEDPSYKLYKSEYDAVFNRLKNKAEALVEAFQQMPGYHCQSPQGAIYLFPRVELPRAAVEAAKLSGDAPDVWYCAELLKKTGVCIVPGSGFGMGDGSKDGNIWFRVTFLGEGDEWIARLKSFQEHFMNTYV
jgi:alanine transaminase